MTTASALDPAAAVPVAQPRSASGLDPRTKMLLVLVASTVVMSPYGSRFVLPGLVLAVALAVSERAWRRAWVMPVLVIGGLLGVWALAQVPANPATSSLLMTCEYLSRFTVAMGVGLHLFTTTSPSALNASLRSMRFPRSAAVTLVVMIRFLPVVMKESAAVFDAMRLRGLTRPATLLPSAKCPSAPERLPGDSVSSDPRWTARNWIRFGSSGLPTVGIYYRNAHLRRRHKPLDTIGATCHAPLSSRRSTMRASSTGRA